MKDKRKKMPEKRILVFPGGTEIGLEIQRALKDCKDIRLYSCNSNESNHSTFVFKNNFLVPVVSDKKWIAELNKIVVREKIDYIYPAHDEVMFALSESRKKIKTEIIIPTPETCAIARSKSKIYLIMKNLIPTPAIIDDINKASWPLFLKPDNGQGSQNAFIVRNRKELDFYLTGKENMLILEYLPGKEYTVDCFSNIDSKLLFCGGRERLRIRNGIAVSSRIVKNSIFREYAEKISVKLKMQGAWFFQLKTAKNGELKLLEIAPRVSGTMSVFRMQGVNFPLLSIYQKAGMKIEIMTNNCEVQVDRALSSQYKHNIKYNNVYIDFDDTIIIKNKVNIGLIKFIYQCRNNRKKIFLLTKTNQNIKTVLEKYGVSENVFTQVIKLKKGDNKADFINKKSAIFIDDSFGERKDVYQKRKIPTFDPSMLELLAEE